MCSPTSPWTAKGCSTLAEFLFRFGVPELLSSLYNFCWVLGQWKKTHWNPPFTWLAQMDHNSMTMGYPEQQNDPKILGLWIQRSSLQLWNFCNFVGLDIAERKMAPFRIKNGCRLSQRLSYHKSIPPPLLFVVVGCWSQYHLLVGKWWRRWWKLELSHIWTSKQIWKQSRKILHKVKRDIVVPLSLIFRMSFWTNRVKRCTVNQKELWLLGTLRKKRGKHLTTHHFTSVPLVASLKFKPNRKMFHEILKRWTQSSEYILRASPSVLSIWSCPVKLDEEKSKYAGLAQENLPWLVKGTAMLVTSRKQSNKHDLSSDQCFSLAHHKWLVQVVCY